jgi:hypothetical protein
MRVSASLILMVAAAGIGLLTLVEMLLIAGDIDYDGHPLQQGQADVIAIHVVAAMLCLLAAIIPVLEDRPPRMAWLGLVSLAGASLVGCSVVVVSDMAPGTLMQQLTMLGAIASAFCVTRLLTTLRPTA